MNHELFSQNSQLQRIYTICLMHESLYVAFVLECWALIGRFWSIFLTTIGCVRAVVVVMTSQHHVPFICSCYDITTLHSILSMHSYALRHSVESQFTFCVYAFIGICKITQHIKLSLARDGFEPQTL